LIEWKKTALGDDVMEHDRVTALPRGRFGPTRTHIKRRQDSQRVAAVLPFPGHKRRRDDRPTVKPFMYAVIFVGIVSVVFAALVALKRTLGR
jgi:hypothetical protein